MKREWIVSGIVFTTMFVVSVLHSQTINNADNIDPLQRRHILLAPNGLETLAKMSGGSFVMEALKNGGFFDYSILSAEKDSTLIVNGTITGANTHLANNGNDILTDYVVRPDDVLKGVPPALLLVEIQGGKVTFKNGNSAEIKSLLTEHIKVGKSYFLFLTNEAGTGIYDLVGKYQTVFDTSVQDKIIPLAQYFTKRHFTILDEVANDALVTKDNLTEQVKAVVAEKK